MKKRLIPLVVVSLAWMIVLAALLCTADARAASPAQTPTVDEVAPSSAPNDLDTTIVVTGSGFVAVPTVTLGNTLLEDVAWVSAERLTATVPWGLITGTYTLSVTNPGGESGGLTDAVTVTQGIGVWATGGPYGGRVQQIIVHPVTPTTAYAVVSWVGAFATFDSAEHWEPMVSDRNPIRLALDAQDPAVMYLSSSRFLRTMDGGTTWEPLAEEWPPPFFHPENGCFTIYPAPHPTQAGVIYVGTGSCEGIPVLPGEGGAFFSDDYGNTWITLTVGLTDTDLVDLAFHPADPDTMAAATLSGNVFTTTDGGLTWHWAADLDQQLRRIYFNPSGTHEAWIVPYAEYQPPSTPYLYKSTDPGLSTWITTVVTDDLVTGGGIWSLTFLSDTVWAAGDRGFVSADGGGTWTPVMGGEDPINTIQTFAFPPGDDQMIYVGSEMDGVAKSMDGGATWQEKNEGLAGLQVRGLATPRGQIDTIYANTFERGILRSDDGGRAWLELAFFHGGSPKGQILATDPFAPERVYFADSCEDLPCMQVSADRGATWQEVTMTLPITWAGWMGRTLMSAPHPGVAGRILAGVGFCYDTAHCNSGNEPSGIYASDDYGQNWSYLGPTPAISEVLSIAYDMADPDLIYAGTRGMSLWRSTDGGDTWAAAPIPGVLPPIHVVSIAPHPDIAGTVYVRLYSYADDPNPQPNLFVSDDGGVTWQELPDVDTVFGGIGGRGLVFVPPAPDAVSYTLYSGCDPGLCSSPDGGYTWELAEGAPRPSSNNLFNTAMVANSNSERTRLYVGTSGGIASTAKQVAAPRDMIPGLGSIMRGGVYRMTLAPPGGFEVYLPLVLKGFGP